MKMPRLFLHASLIAFGILGLSLENAENEPTGSDQRTNPIDSKTAEAPPEEPEQEPAADGIFRPKYGESFEGKVVVLKVGKNSLMGDSAFAYLERIVKKADLEKAEAVILDMDTPGGLSWNTESLVLTVMMDLSIPTYTFVNPRALSAGSIIAISTDKIYMRPAATIGSALTIMATGQDLPETLKKKVQAQAIAMIRNVAEVKGHNPDVAAAFVSDNTKVKIGKELIHNGKTVLNLNTIDATRVIDGKPVLAAGEVDSIEELMALENLTGPIVRAEPLGMESFALWVQMLSPVLIILGIGGAYMELKAPGFGLPGAISIICFSIFFFGNNLAGRLAGFELAVLLVIGLVLIGIEIFLLPGTMIPSLAGGFLVIISLGMAMIDGVEFDWKFADREGAESWLDLISGPTLVIAIGFAGGLLVVFAALKYLPQTRIGNWMVLEKAVAGGASLGEETTSQAESYEGRTGVAESDLRPAGKGRFEGKLLDITADGEFIEVGSALRIVKHEGSRVVVERA